MIERRKTINLGNKILEEITIDKDVVGALVTIWLQKLKNYCFDTHYKDDPFAWLSCVLALKAASQGNFGVGSIIVDDSGMVLSFGHNQMFKPYFRSDLHAEMVAINDFEDNSYSAGNRLSGSLYTSLESCPMCLTRFINSGLQNLYYVVKDDQNCICRDGDNYLSGIWIDIAKRKHVNTARCAPFLRKAAKEIYLINAERLNNILIDRNRKKNKERTEG